MDNILLYLILSVVIAAVVSEWLARRGWLPVFVLRKAIHVFVSALCVFAFVKGLDYRLLTVLGLIGSMVLYFVIRSGKMLAVDQQDRKSWGIVFFALAFSFNALFVYPYSPEIAVFSTMLVGISDPFAAVIGRWFPFYPIRLTGDRKTISGALAFALSVPAVALFSDVIGPVPIFYPLDTSSALFLIYAAIVFSAVELMSSRGSDNLTLTVFSGAILWGYLFDYSGEMHWLLTFGLSALVALVSHRLRLLSLSGAVMTFIMAFFIFGLGGWQWTLPLFAFFLLSSVLSKIKARINPDSEYLHEKTGIRDFKQVLANGGLPTLVLLTAVLFQKTDELYAVYLVAIAAATSDTWSTELGGICKGKTYDIIGLKPVPQGLSGGISVYGTIGGFLGAFAISLFGFWSAEVLTSSIAIIAVFGFLGTLIDSLLGSLFQIKYINPDGQITEKSKFFELRNRYYSGIHWMNNDVVNILSTSLATLLYFLIVRFIAIL